MHMGIAECVIKSSEPYRDIKPSNYAIGREELQELRRIYILDFGMCRKYLDENNKFRPPRKVSFARNSNLERKKSRAKALKLIHLRFLNR